MPLLGKAVEERVFPAASAAISVNLQNIRLQFFFETGAPTYEKSVPAQAIDRSSCFDLASLTKPLATTLAVMHLLDAGLLRLEDTLPELIESEVPPDKEKISLRHLLCHASGLAAYQPYFKKLVLISPDRRKSEIQRWILSEPLQYETGEKSLYSDLGFLLLGFMIEKKTGMPLDIFVEQKIMQPFGFENAIFFNRLSGAQRKVFFVPTENCPWRHKILHGEVHDDNAYCLDGVAGHAGLFGDAQGVLALTEILLDLWQGSQNQKVLSDKTVQRFLTRQADIVGSTWALGFDTPDTKKSSSGRYFSPRSVGHLGFTGTSFWIDPERQLSVVLLTNRVFPDRENIKIRHFRPLLHDRIIEGLELV